MGKLSFQSFIIFICINCFTFLQAQSLPPPPGWPGPYERIYTCTFDLYERSSQGWTWVDSFTEYEYGRWPWDFWDQQRACRLAKLSCEASRSQHQICRLNEDAFYPWPSVHIII